MSRRKTIRTSLAAAGLWIALLMTPAWGEPAPWMKKARPNELGLRLSVHPQCPNDQPRYERAISRVFNEQWIERVPLASREAYLHIEIWCQVSVAVYPYTIHAEFAVFDEPYSTPRSMGPGYDAAGASSYAEILQQTMRIARQALSDHVSANFDL
jgi:hypothetical protein